jgi:hypothetical protein
MPRPLQNVDFIDTHALFEACDSIATSHGVGAKLTINYQNLSGVLTDMRRAKGWRPTDMRAAMVSADTASDSQMRFVTMLERTDFEPDVCHYRDLYISTPPGRSPAEFGEKPRAFFAPRISYAIGLMATRENPQILVVSHAFELYWPLADLSRRIPQAKVGLAFFSSLVDFRWKNVGLFDPRSPITFFDLETESERLLGIDMVGSSRAASGRSGLSRL